MTISPLQCLSALHVLIRGAGDLASGVAWRLHRCHMSVTMLELPAPLVIRRSVSFASAIHTGSHTVEGVTARLTSAPSTTPSHEHISIYVDPRGLLIRSLAPHVVIDARMAKAPLDTRLGDAPLVIGLGPGFLVGTHCHAVVETKRGHFLGRVYYHGQALQDSGTPGSLGGETVRRVMRAPAGGIFRTRLQPGVQVLAGDVLGTVDEVPVISQLSGLLRGLMYSGTPVEARTKVADVDPRPHEEVDLESISDKARAIGGGVLEAILHSLGGLRP